MIKYDNIPVRQCSDRSAEKTVEQSSESLQWGTG